MWKSFWSWWQAMANRQPSKQRPRRKSRLSLELLEDRTAPAIYLVTTLDDIDDVTGNPVAGSLRQAILNANANPGQDTIRFDIGNAPQTISIDGVPLPNIMDSVIIDAATNPANRPNQRITLDGTGVNGPGLAFTTGMNTSASNSRVIRLAIQRFAGDGILLNNVSFVTIGGRDILEKNTIIDNQANGIHITGFDAQNNTIIGNYIGTDVNSTANLGNDGYGIRLDGGTAQNAIGGLDDAERNTISSNDGGIFVQNSASNTICGNFIGTSTSGSAPYLGNSGPGIRIEGQSANNTIGGIVATTNGVINDPANVICANRDGIEIDGANTTGTQIQGNFVGVNRTGTVAGSNNPALAGIYLTNAVNVTIGGPQAGAANVVSANGVPQPRGGPASGIEVTGGLNILIQGNNIGTSKDRNNQLIQLGNSGDGISLSNTRARIKDNAIRNNGGAGVRDTSGNSQIFDPNLIFENGALGIDIGADGVTTTGVPVLTTATVAAGTITVQGTLNSTPNSTFLLEFFGNDTPDPSGYGEGEYFLGNTTISTDANGDAVFSVLLNTVSGQYLTATSTGMDEGGNTSEFSSNIPLVFSNSPPHANDDNLSTQINTIISENVMTNDTDADGDDLWVTAVNGDGTYIDDANGMLLPSGAKLSMDSYGNFNYTPPPEDWTGADSFTYTITDGIDTAMATVKITVGSSNTAPTAADYSYTVIHDQTLSVYAPGILGNNPDMEYDPLSIQVIAGPAHGTLTLNQDGGFDYVPTSHYSGSDSFTYQLNDGQADSNVATVSIDVTNTAPEVSSDSYTLIHDQPLTIWPIYWDGDGDPVSIISYGSPSNGSVSFDSLSNSFTFTYTPSAGFTGQDSFTYTVSDGITEATGTISLTVTNSAPEAPDASYTISNDQPASLLPMYWDPDGDSVTMVSYSTPAHGTLTFDSLTASFTYTPDANYTGSDSFTYTISDGIDEATGTINLAVEDSSGGDSGGDGGANSPPVTGDDSISTNVNMPVTINVLVNDTDPDGDALIVTSAGPPSTGPGGLVVLNSDFTITYTPPVDWTGTDYFYYYIDDGHAHAVIGYVTVFVV